MQKYLLLLLFFAFFVSAKYTCLSQNYKADDKQSAIIDSLLNLIKNTKVDTLKIKTYNKLFLEYEFKDRVKAKDCLSKALTLSKKSNFKNWLAETYIFQGYYYEDEGAYLEALENYNLSLKLREELHDKKGMATSYHNMGNVFYALGNYTEALKNYFSALKIREFIGDKNGIATSYINIGLVYYNQGNFIDAIKHYKACLNLYETVGNRHGVAYCYTYLGLVFHKQGKIDEAIINHTASLMIRKELNNIKGIAECYNNLGGVYSSKSNHTEALKNYFASIEIKKQIGDRKGIATTYGNIGISYIYNKNFKDAEKYLKSSMELLFEIGAKENIKGCFYAMSVLDSTKGNFKGAYNNYKMFVLYKDSIDNEESRKKTIQSQMAYEFEKKEAVATAEHKKELENQNAIAKEKSRKQIIVIVFVVVGLLLVVIFAGFILRSLKITRKQKETIETQKQIVDEKNSQLNQQNEEISTQRDEIEAQRDEIEAQRDLVTEQKVHIEEVHKEVTDSINYAKRIQEALLPVSDSARSVLGEHFILFKPRNIVSGDFYWTTKINNLLFVAVADCTGHGVPGAFMSMLGISFLNEIVQKQEINKPSQILNQLRIEIINALQQKGVHGEQKDGMDISLLVLNTETNEAQWAGANNPLYIVKSQKSKVESVDSNFQLSDFSEGMPTAELYELKGDKMPIAIYPVMKDFTNHEFVLQKGDCIFLFTDGYPDQFGGAKGRKFMYKQLKEILLINCHDQMVKQQEVLEASFANWKGDFEQIDDITIFGIRI